MNNDEFSNHPSEEQLLSNETSEELERHRRHCTTCRKIWLLYLKIKEGYDKANRKFQAQQYAEQELEVAGQIGVLCALGKKERLDLLESFRWNKHRNTCSICTVLPFHDGPFACLSDATVRDFVLGEMTHDERGIKFFLEGHVDRCATCKKKVRKAFRSLGG